MKSRVTIAIYASIAFLVMLSIVVMGPFLLSIALGAAFAIALLPLKERFSRFSGAGNKTSSTIVCTLFALFILTPMMFSTWSLVKHVQASNGFTNYVGDFENKSIRVLSKTSKLINKNIESEMIAEYVHNARVEANDWVQKAAKDFLSSLPDLIVNFLIIVLAMFLVLTGYRKTISKMRISKVFSTQTVIQIDAIVTAACRDVFFSNIIAGAFQSLLVAIGIAVFTEHDPYLTFVFTFIVSFIPIIGAAPVAAVAAVYELVNQNFSGAIALAVLTVIVGVSDNIVRAMLMAHDEEDSSVVNLLASIGGIYVWGLPGLFIGPLVVTLAIKITPLLLKELRRQPPTVVISQTTSNSQQLILVEPPSIS